MYKIDKNLLKNLLKEGMKKAYTDAVFFAEKVNKPIKNEYLITVNVAKVISKNNPYLASPYKVFLEYSTKKFSTDCIPVFKRLKTEKRYSAKFIRRKKDAHNTNRKGKIDIAVYKENVSGISDDNFPFCAIEVKSFNPSKKVVLNDLSRNLEYFTFLDTTGLSKIKYAAFIAFQSYDSWRHSDIQKKIHKLESRYYRYLDELDLSYIGADVEGFCVSSDLFTGNEETHEAERIYEDRHLFLGIIVIFHR